MNSRNRVFRAALLVFLCTFAGIAFGQIGSPQELVVKSDGDSIRLYWDAVPSASSYNVYKDVIPQVDLSFPYGSADTNSFADYLQSGLKYFYAVTANVPAGCLSGTITDTNSVAAPGVWVSGKLQSDTTVTFHALTLSNGTYSVCDLLVGTYTVYVYLQYRPVLEYDVTILDGQTTTLNAQWQPFTWVSKSGHITASRVNEVWTNDNVYQLTSYVWVDSGATLTIERGTTFVGNYPTLGMIVVGVGGQCFMNGEQYLPIVGCSNRPIGERRSGDWGGVSIMGRAHSNRTNGGGSYPVVPNGEGDTGPACRPDTLYDNESSGVFRYVRLEHSGFRFTPTNELNGFAMYGVGRGTVMSYVQSACSKDDQIEFFGGALNADHIVCHSTGDDGFDWTDGWNGAAQFVVIQNRGPESDHCIEADNYENGYDFLPRSNPRLANFTLIHAKDLTPTGNSGNAMQLRRGTLFNIHNFVVTLGRLGGAELDDSSTAWQASQNVDGNYWTRILNGNSVIDNSLFWNNGPLVTETIDSSTPAGIGDGHFWVEDAEWDLVNCRSTQKMCINITHICAPTGWTQDVASYRGCGFTGFNTTTRIADPMLINPTPNTGAAGYDPRPQAGSPCLNPANAAPVGSLPPGIQYVPYIGAFSGPNDNWMEGWTAFPLFYEN